MELGDFIKKKEGKIYCKGEPNTQENKWGWMKISKKEYITILETEIWKQGKLIEKLIEHNSLKGE